MVAASIRHHAQDENIKGTNKAGVKGRTLSPQSASSPVAKRTGEGGAAGDGWGRPRAPSPVSPPPPASLVPLPRDCVAGEDADCSLAVYPTRTALSLIERLRVLESVGSTFSASGTLSSTSTSPSDFSTPSGIAKLKRCGLPVSTYALPTGSPLTTTSTSC